MEGRGREGISGLTEEGPSSPEGEPQPFMLTQNPWGPLHHSDSHRQDSLSSSGKSCLV